MKKSTLFSLTFALGMFSLAPSHAVIDIAAMAGKSAKVAIGAMCNKGTFSACNRLSCAASNTLRSLCNTVCPHAKKYSKAYKAQPCYKTASDSLKGDGAMNELIKNMQNKSGSSFHKGLGKATCVFANLEDETVLNLPEDVKMGLQEACFDVDGDDEGDDE